MNTERSDTEPEGFSVPIHQALVEPLLMLGIPRNVCLLFWTLGSAIAFGMQEIWLVPILVFVHFCLMWLTSIDPYFATVFMCAVKAPKRLEP